MPEVEKSLDIQDYLDASSDASSRTRNVHFIIVIASVLVFAGLVNSLQSSWMLARIHASNTISSPYVVSKIGQPPAGASATAEAIEAHRGRYQEYYAALMRTYVDSSYVIRVPVFGFTLDANDLGMLGGIGFVVILVVFQLCLAREIDNLYIAFRVAREKDQLVKFYNLLAMRQVFTVPRDKTRERGKMALWIPRAFSFAPLTVHLGVTAHDVLTAIVGSQLSDARTTVLFLCEISIALVLFALTLRIVDQLRELDSVWDMQWEDVKAVPEQSSAAMSGSSVA